MMVMNDDSDGDERMELSGRNGKDQFAKFDKVIYVIEVFHLSLVALSLVASDKARRRQACRETKIFEFVL